MKLHKKQSGKAIREYMKLRGMKRQRQLALDLGLSEPTISLYLSGKRRFSSTTALRVARKTGIPMERLFQ